MAIKDTSNKQSQQTSYRNFTTDSKAEENYQQFKTSTEGPRKNFMSGGIYAAPISPTYGSESYNRLKEQLIEIFKSTEDPFTIGVVDLDKGKYPNLKYSCIILTTTDKSLKNNTVAFHILVIESTGDPIPVSVINIDGQQVENFRTPSDAVDDVLLELAFNRVSQLYPNYRPEYCDATVVPKDFDLENKISVYTLASNTALATSTILRTTSPDFTDLNLKGEGVLHTEINIAFGRNQRFDAVRNPMRSDVIVDFRKRRTGNHDSQSLNDSGSDVIYSTATGFIDLLWDPVDPMGMYNYNANPAMMAQMNQKYAARLVITDLVSYFGLTPGSILLALMTTLSLRDKNNWYQVFKPNKTDGRLDLADIGALNIEANVLNDSSGFGKRIDTKSASSSLTEIGTFLNMVVKPGLMISLDCPEAGPQSWYLEVFSAASRGSENAKNVIYNAANQLTGGEFAKHFPHNAPMFVDTDNRIHLGRWRDHNGNERDIRDFDHLAVINLMGEKDPKYTRDWSDTFLRKEIPLEKRLAARRRMIMGLSGDSAEFTGYANRVTFTAQFMDALSTALASTGLAVITNTPMSAQDWQNQRGVASFAQDALLAPTTHSFGTYKQGGVNPNSYNQTNNAWRRY